MADRWKGKTFVKLFKDEVKAELHSSRHTKIPIYCQSTLKTINDKTYVIWVYEAWLGGMRIFGAIDDLEEESVVKIKIELGPGLSTVVTARVAWVKEGCFAGLQLGVVTPTWNHFIEILEDNFKKRDAKAS